MPLLFHSALPLDRWDLLHSPFRAMTGLFWYLTAFLTSTSVLSGSNVEGVGGQYLLGLGEFSMPISILGFKVLPSPLKVLETLQGMHIPYGCSETRF